MNKFRVTSEMHEKKFIPAEKKNCIKKWGREIENAFYIIKIAAMFSL